MQRLTGILVARGEYVFCWETQCLFSETLQGEPWAKAASFGIWMEISDCVNLNVADFFQLNYSHKRSLSLDTGAE